MTSHREPLRFTWRGHLFQIIRDYQSEEGFLGICDGRIIARADSRAGVAAALIHALYP